MHAIHSKHSQQNTLNTVYLSLHSLYIATVVKTKIETFHER